jgi:hypothetical protein
MTYCGNKILNPHTILYFIGFIFFFNNLAIIYLESGGMDKRIYIGAFVFCILYFIFSWGCWYFIIEDDTLIIKNYAFPFHKAKYPLDSIQKILFESGSRKYPVITNGNIRIITKGSKRSVLYGASSLKTEQWKAFIRDIRDHHVETEININSFK